MSFPFRPPEENEIRQLESDVIRFHVVVYLIGFVAFFFVYQTATLRTVPWSVSLFGMLVMAIMAYPGLVELYHRRLGESMADSEISVYDAKNGEATTVDVDELLDELEESDRE